MRNTLLFFCIILICVNVFPQSPNYTWAQSFGGNQYDGMIIASDQNGNVYGTGSFPSDSISFGSFIFHNDSIGSSKGDFFLVKFDQSGGVIWAKSVAGPGDEGATAIAVDGSGNVYVGGGFNSPSLTFDSFVLNNPSRNPLTFFAKYDPSGNVIWAKSSTAQAYFKGAETDNNNNVLFTGYFNTASVTFGTTTLTNAGATNCFTVKMNSAGNYLWAKQATNGIGDVVQSRGMAVDSRGCIYITGYFNAPHVIFGGINLINTYVGHSDIFVVKYDTAGNVVWGQKAGGTGYDNGYGIACDLNDNLYVMGNYGNPSMTFGTFTVTTSASTTPWFLAKLDTGGVSLWVRNSTGTSNTTQPYSITTDIFGNIYTTGAFGSTPITFDTYTLTCAGSYDIFITNYDANGNITWAMGNGNSGNDQGRCVTTDPYGNLYLAGVFRSATMTMGGTVLTNNYANDDIVFAKIGNATYVGSNYVREDNILLYPNPASTNISIVVKENEKIRHIIISDLLGNIIMETTSSRIDVENFQIGIYFATVYSDNGTFTKKFVVGK
ncbi:MAG: SBBP repeat-containing protein [Bacteroidia bacterium]